MKKVSALSLTGIILAIACGTLAVMGQQVAAAAVGLVAYFTALFGFKNETAPWQAYALLGVSLVFGYSICPPQGKYILAPSILFFGLLSAVRILLWEKLSHSRMTWLEPLFFFLGLTCYAAGNIYDGSGWVSWVFPFPVLAMAGFMIFGALSEKSLVSKLDKNKKGAELGKPAPVFTLSDHDGKQVSLSDFKDRRHVLLIFVRGDWCPTCHIMLRCYEKHKEKFGEKNIMLMAIGPDPVGINRDMVKRLNLEYKLLSDEKNAAAKAYGMHLLPNNPMTKYEEGIPLPASFLVDMQGNLVYTSDPRRPGEVLNPDTIFPVVESLAN